MNENLLMAFSLEKELMPCLVQDLPICRVKSVILYSLLKIFYNLFEVV